MPLASQDKDFPVISELRQDIVTGDWVIIAKARAQKPGAMKTMEAEMAQVDPSDCPFCYPEKTGQKKGKENRRQKKE